MPALPEFLVRAPARRHRNKRTAWNVGGWKNRQTNAGRASNWDKARREKRRQRDSQSECKPEGGTLSQPALDADRATHALDQFLRNGETQAGAPVATGEGAVSLDELFKNQCELILRDADSG